MKDKFYEGYDPDDAAISESVRKPTIAQAGLLFSICMLMFLFIGSRVQRREFYSGVLITEFILILLPALGLIFFCRYNFKQVLRLNRVSFLNIFLIVCIMIFAMPVVGVFNLANIWLVKLLFGKVALAQVPIAADSTGLLLSVLVIGGSAGICEEVLFRGAILRGFERLGTAKAILITSFLFGLMHVDLQKLFGTFLLGALIGFIVYRTNSLFSGIIAHFTNNSVAVLLTYGANKLNETLKSSGIENVKGQYDADQYISSLLNMPRAQLIGAVIVWAFIIAFCAAVLVGLVIAFFKTTSDRAEKAAMDRKAFNIEGFAVLVPGLALVALIYTAQGLRLKGLNVEFVNSIIRLIGLK